MRCHNHIVIYYRIVNFELAGSDKSSFRNDGLLQVRGNSFFSFHSTLTEEQCSIIHSIDLKVEPQTILNARFLNGWKGGTLKNIRDINNHIVNRNINISNDFRY